MDVISDLLRMLEECLVSSAYTSRTGVLKSRGMMDATKSTHGDRLVEGQSTCGSETKE